MLLSPPPCGLGSITAPERFAFVTELGIDSDYSLGGVGPEKLREWV